ncbi:MAG: ParA family protein [Dysgonomonas sp.]
MKKKTLNVAFSTQKGGAGKTTLTVLVASYLHYVKGYNVAVIDCDFPQHSIAEMRERDLQMTMDDEHYKLMAYQQFSALGKKAYVIVESTPENAVEDAQEVLDTLKPDFLFFDLPGTINNPSVVQTLSLMDYIIAPISADRLVLESTLQYVITLRGKYPALCQRGDKFVVYRDNNKDVTLDFNEATTDYGYFGINFHKAGENTQFIGANSAGCQVTQKSADFNHVMMLAEKARNIYGNSFTYTLLDEKDFDI